MNTYAVNTMGHNWLGDLNARKSEDISGLLEERSFVLRQKLIERRVRFNAGMGIPVNVRTTSSKKEINLVENVQNFFNNAKKYFTKFRNSSKRITQSIIKILKKNDS